MKSGQITDDAVWGTRWWQNDHAAQLWLASAMLMEPAEAPQQSLALEEAADESVFCTRAY